MNKAIFRLPALVILCLSLQGCVVGAVADLAATTVVTAGKLAVKGTGAVIGAMIPDGDKDEKKSKKKEETVQTAPKAVEVSQPEKVVSQPETVTQTQPVVSAEPKLIDRQTDVHVAEPVVVEHDGWTETHQSETHTETQIWK
ncbi:NF038104 family lipoprotein [Kingella negevensis]|uniref:NF038104 family lipoprotein n=1 Tax=Kingella negevensis TaxID=1522312 RepID=UPI0032B4A6C6